MEQECFHAGLVGEAGAQSLGSRAGGSCSGALGEGALSSLGLATCKNRTQVVFHNIVKIDTIRAVGAYGLFMGV